jgi:hypothetical protein
MIAFKEPQLIHQYHQLHPKVVEVVEWIDREIIRALLWQKFLVVTAIHYEGGSGVHADYRAVDWSARDYHTGILLSRHRCLAVQAAINEAWDHGSEGLFNVCWYHQAVGGEWHFHTQVRPTTGLR